MEIKQNETLEDYYVRKGYYQRIDNVLPPEINPEKFSYFFDAGLETIIKYEREAFRGGIANHRYAILDKTLTEAQMDCNISRIRASERAKKKKEEQERFKPSEDGRKKYLNKIETRCKRLSELIEFIKTPENEIYLKELVNEYIKIKHEYAFGVTPYMEMKTMMSFENSENVKTLKDSSSSTLLTEIINEHEQQYKADVKATEEKRKNHWESIETKCKMKRDEDYKRIYELVTKYKKREEINQQIAQLQAQLETL